MPNLFWIKIAGACINIDKKAQYEIKPRGTETKYSCAIADMKKTIKLAISFEDPIWSKGL